jgi:hypothetical protein
MSYIAIYGLKSQDRMAKDSVVLYDEVREKIFFLVMN